jgi:hypothetical protein
MVDNAVATTKGVSASDYVIAIAGIEYTAVGNADAAYSRLTNGYYGIACYYVITITSIELVNDYNAANANTSNSILTLSSIDAGQGVDIYARLITTTCDCVVTIASIYAAGIDINSVSFFANATNYVVTITSINPDAA